MRVTATILAVMATTLAGLQGAQAQSTDKPQSAAAAKTQSAAKGSTAQVRPATPAVTARGSTNAGKASFEGVSPMRSTPADSKKDGGCSHSMARDA
jgi:outer membrane lipoprotein SlyB